MSDVPIFDEAYFARRAQQRHLEASLRYWDHFADSRRHDSIEQLREDYALGKIDLETFQRRLDRVLR